MKQGDGGPAKRTKKRKKLTAKQLKKISKFEKEFPFVSFALRQEIKKEIDRLTARKQGK